MFCGVASSFLDSAFSSLDFSFSSSYISSLSDSSPLVSSSSASSFSTSFSGSSSHTGASSCTGVRGDSTPCGDYGSLPASETLLVFYGFLIKSSNRASSSTSAKFAASARNDKLSFSGVKGVSSARALVFLSFEDEAFYACSDRFLFALVQEGLPFSFFLKPLLVLAGPSIPFPAIVPLCSYFNSTSHVIPFTSNCFKTKIFIRL